MHCQPIIEEAKRSKHIQEEVASDKLILLDVTSQAWKSFVTSIFIGWLVGWFVHCVMQDSKTSYKFPIKNLRKTFDQNEYFGI